MIETITTAEIDRALAALSAGEVIVFPTETSYGLGCDATNEAAVERVVEIKGRDRGKGLPLLVPALEDIEHYVDFSPRARELAATHWPGALNIVAPTAKNSPVAAACAVDGTQAVRLSAHQFARALTERFGRPLVATSANLSGVSPIFDPSDFSTMFNAARGLPNLFIDGGALEITPPSTTVKVIGDEVTVIRQGSVEISSL